MILGLLNNEDKPNFSDRKYSKISFPISIRGYSRRNHINKPFKTTAGIYLIDGSNIPNNLGSFLRNQKKLKSY